MYLLSDLLGKPAADIDTPALVIDLDTMDRNLASMAAFAAKHQVRLRPHAKMHKSATLAKLQMAHGAVGVCVQKTAEAEALAALGVNNIYISNEVVSPFKLKRVVALAKELQALGGQLAIAVDSLEGLQRLARAAHGQHTVIRVFIEIDVGHGRCGLTPGAAAVPLAAEIARHPALQFGGLQAYHGRAQHFRSVSDRHSGIAQVVNHVQATQAALQAAGHVVPLVTGAGTGTFSLETASGVYGELQAGSYLFMDRDYADNERDPAQPQFEHALFVKSQVMSVSASHAVVDAGHKSHAIDSGLPAVHGLDLEYANGGDEHGILRGAVLPALGDTVWLIPGHCDPTVNLHDHLLGVRGGLQHGTVEQIIKVDARGALT
ncbi:DSD1 family PLP-dependent enzyme [Polaromonas sp. SM01]|uniref:DSD1 family PLP-dependent enzyme n=1 Tax=Polaromonas sp. SM01 TaxID=3085630 RepID=UPI002981C5F0|nr:DSD1 family PLP-dependent enzyme [Polaromonas sp. SM01]MDW5445106.1 DSD1 family PLP-dependent enzyme [Polaromonas sp. SM01]